MPSSRALALLLQAKLEQQREQIGVFEVLKRNEVDQEIKRYRVETKVSSRELEPGCDALAALSALAHALASRRPSSPSFPELPQGGFSENSY